MSLKRNLLLTGFVLLGSAGLAQAEMAATTATDIEVRSGPGAEFPTVGVATRGSKQHSTAASKVAAGAGSTSTACAAGSMRNI